MIGHERLDDDLDPVLGGLLTAAYDEQVDVDTAARHLWTIHRIALRQRAGLRHNSLRLTSVAAMAFAMLLGLSGTVSTIRPVVTTGLSDEATEVAGDDIAPVIITPAGEMQARALLAHSEKRIAEAEAVVTRRPATVPSIVGDAVESIERAEAIAGPVVADESEPLREGMADKVTQLASNPAVDDASRAKLMVYALRLSGSGESDEDPVLVTRRKEKLTDPSPTPAEEPADEQEPAEEPPVVPVSDGWSPQPPAAPADEEEPDDGADDTDEADGGADESGEGDADGDDSGGEGDGAEGDDEAADDAGGDTDGSRIAVGDAEGVEQDDADSDTEDADAADADEGDADENDDADEGDADEGDADENDADDADPGRDPGVGPAAGGSDDLDL